MSRLRNLFRRDGSRQPFTRLVLEELEDRVLATTASAEVAAIIVNSPEHSRKLVTTDYTSLLHRFPDTVGLNSWVNALQSGLTSAQMDAAFAASPEYIASKGGIGTGWIQALYQDFLQRMADSDGLVFWTTATAGEPPLSIALSFALSPERNEALITGAYVTILSRLPEPSALAYWQTQFQTGLTLNGLDSQIIGSDEFYTRTGNANLNFIAGAYEAALQRPPAQQEIDFWLGFMATQ
jgi:hypothetical protein